MTDIRAFRALSLLTTVGVLVVTACTIQLRGGVESLAPPKAEQMTDATSSDLARCRSVAAEQAEGFERCKQVWAENRRRFFGKNDRAATPVHDASAPGVALFPKDQSRIPLGYLKLVAPEVSKP
ncbi:putative entry exclusion protein TrbK-alt [Bradyrhizobium arachidis]|uniref:Conjugative transfer region protein TrbK n=1 Tax=Bradyrhizobium arachidis TaxID=858423 RepID=A0AAE7NZU6_9BRAD|nr:putative entry exclusion protein TrbK-alt [Bradyrhizobium arachidis]QOZ72573.1 hypothetical protein WN72_44515 [Bradyrhizobium arachidis]SFU90337.1 conjugative transfer region protein TrbK [Bradyrhizobium arachidis]